MYNEILGQQALKLLELGLETILSTQCPCHVGHCPRMQDFPCISTFLNGGLPPSFALYGQCLRQNQNYSWKSFKLSIQDSVSGFIQKIFEKHWGRWREGMKGKNIGWCVYLVSFKVIVTSLGVNWVEPFQLTCWPIHSVLIFSSVQFSCSVVSDSLWPHE